MDAVIVDCGVHERDPRHVTVVTVESHEEVAEQAERLAGERAAADAATRLVAEQAALALENELAGQRARDAVELEGLMQRSPDQLAVWLARRLGFIQSVTP